MPGLMIRFFAIVGLVVFAITGSLSQSQFGLYQLGRSVPLANSLNPAFMPDSRVVFGIPVMSSVYAQASPGFAFNDVMVRGADDSLRIDRSLFMSTIGNKLSIEANAEVSLFYLGIRTKNMYFNLSANERISAVARIPKDFFQLALYGNGDPLNFGEVLDFSGLGARANYYHEIGFGVTRNITENFTVGARLKMLFGVANLETTDISSQFITSQDSIHLSVNRFEMQNTGSGYLDATAIGDRFLEDLPFKSPSKGYALDLGARYWVSKRLSIAGSIKDLGKINWQGDTKVTNVDPIFYSFKGFDILDILDGGVFSGPDPIQDEIDSVTNLFSANEVVGASYKTNLTGQVYLSADYQVGKIHNFGAMFYSDVYQGALRPEFTGFYTLKLGQVFSAGLNAGYKNKTLTNIGAGISVKAGGMQIFASSDNIMAFAKPTAAKVVDVRFGFNLAIGKIKDEKRKKREKKEKETEVEDSVIVEPEPIPEDTVVIEPDTVVIAEIVVPEAEPDTIIAPPLLIDTVQANTVVAPLPEPVVVIPELEPVVTVKREEAPLEVPVGYYIVVGAFLSEANAARFSKQIETEGYPNEYGFLTKKGYYYVYIHESDDSNQTLPEVRATRDEYRASGSELLKDAWLLQVVK